MRSFPLLICLLFFPSSVLAQTEPQQQICPAELAPAIEKITNSSPLEASRWGIMVQTLDGEDILYGKAAQSYFTPASNVKLLITAAALHHLGSSYRIRTSVYGMGTAPNLDTVRIVGKGDPSLTSTQLEDLAQQLQRQGVVSIKQLIVEDAYFPEPAINPTWQWEDLTFAYATAVNSLIINENRAILTLLPQKIGEPVQVSWDDPVAARQWRVDNFARTAPESTPYNVDIRGVLGKPWLQITGELAADSKPDPWEMAILDPANYFLESWRRILAAQGIQIGRGVVVDQIAKERGRELASIISAPLAELLVEANQNSNNIYAEALLRILDAQLRDSSAVNRSVDAVKKVLNNLGVEPNSYDLADGSGLSRQNLVSPNAIAQTLQLMATTPQGEVYRSSLSVAGVRGTLRRRFRDTPVQGNLWGKTGTLSGVTALSGYLYGRNYEPLVFSIMVNQSEQRASIHRQAIDEIVLLLASLHPC